MLTYKMYQTCDKKAIHTTRLEIVRSVVPPIAALDRRAASLAG